MRDLQSIVQDNYRAVAHACSRDGVPLVIERNDLAAARWQSLPLPVLMDVPKGYSIYRTFHCADDALAHLRVGYGYAVINFSGHWLACELIQEPTDERA